MRRTAFAMCSGFAALAITLGAPTAGAYPTWSAEQIPTYRAPDGESVGSCNTCHGNFRATNADNSRPWLRDEYFSPTDGQPWSEVYQEVGADAPELEVGLHDVHRHIIVDKIGRSRCNVCHFGPREERFRVFLFMSNGGDGLDPISCLGCHGRPGEGGAGLRQHHTNAGVNNCKTCHEDADPANFTPAGEDVLPSYYAAPNDVFVNKPTNPCNPHGEEDYAGGRQGLDNDGDGLYDKRDPDCRPVGPGNNNGRQLGKK